MFDYDAERLRNVLSRITSSNVSPETWTWLENRLGSEDAKVINTTFSLMPRKTGRHLVNTGIPDGDALKEIKPGFSVDGWTAERLCRVYLLMLIDPSEQDRYFKIIENLFAAAEMSELVALYSALPLLAYPEMWKMRCAEGVRSNIGTVLEAIMYNNPYPAQYIDEKAWNQLILKAIFTDKDMDRIWGACQRDNRELALTLSDYAHERWAAGRKVNPQLWRFTSKFTEEERIMDDLRKVLQEGDDEEKKAAGEAIGRIEN